ncbi:unnamed protein product, partial [Discosporangium mesarthrocarpum]
PYWPQVPYLELFPNASPHAVDLLEGLLVFHPPDRMDVEAALSHPYFDPLKKISSDTELPEGFEFDFENESLTKPELKKLLLEEV